MSINLRDPSQLQGAAVTGSGGDKLGKVDAIYYDNETDQPEWVAVKSGLFGTHVSLVPLAKAEFDGEELHVPYDKQQIKDAPHHDAGRDLSPRDEEELFRHYGLSYSGGSVAAQDGDRASAPGQATEASQWGNAPDMSSRAADEAMTRSEERMRVATESTEVGRARLRKYVVTEHQQVTVPVSHEEVRIDREPITEDNRRQAMAGSPISEGEHEVTLHAERPVVDKEAVPVERVRIGTQTVTEQQEIGEDVRKEHIEVDDPGLTQRAGRNR